MLPPVPLRPGTAPICAQLMARGDHTPAELTSRSCRLSIQNAPSTDMVIFQVRDLSTARDTESHVASAASTGSGLPVTSNGHQR
jgi:hypothetical protein